MKKLLFVAIAFAGLTLVSCNKDQAAVKKLDGTWKATEATYAISGTTTNLLDGGTEISMTFNSCKLKTDEWCTGSQTVTWGGASFTENMLFRVTGDGTVLESKADDTSDVFSMTIVELSKTNATFEQTDTNGGVTTTKAEKQ
ncbi:hypothetical protein K6119_19275 [Paracrocinitomix mangrovi]|uniref:hypothetical protein n=1 Tax=Paracrocinitomix mangrovi TaxID=2862509 RepID=UPI001C8E2378|nr:hypothetical protein [Paracrocinitomix mangrovi]UKN01868.1 hypothetical protein K6119_19275 [Paracrocinitomix mangrovi]